MKPISVITSRVCPFDANDVDTDLIIPKQFLKRVERTGYGPYLFFERRYDEDGNPDPDFVMNKPEHQGAQILLSGRNFGSGSSREHAVWALQESGFDAVIAVSFADIFRGNCGKSGMAAVTLPADVIRHLFALVEADPAVQVTVDLPAQRVRADGVGDLEGVDVPFDFDAHTKNMLINGLDEIALTLQHEDDIAAFEAQRESWRPKVPTPS
ncbi:MAG: 3-isopropylmalate dehydratase small subunit [Nitriliruptoraceae bacterium]